MCVKWVEVPTEVKGNRYSVPTSHCYKQVTIRIRLVGELSVCGIRNQLQDCREGWHGAYLQQEFHGLA